MPAHFWLHMSCAKATAASCRHPHFVLVGKDSAPYNYLLTAYQVIRLDHLGSTPTPDGSGNQPSDFMHRVASFSPVAMLDTPLPEGRGGSRGRAFRRLEADVERPSARRCIVREGRVGVETERGLDASLLLGRMIGRVPVDFSLSKRCRLSSMEKRSDVAKCSVEGGPFRCPRRFLRALATASPGRLARWDEVRESTAGHIDEAARGYLAGWRASLAVDHLHGKHGRTGLGSCRIAGHYVILLARNIYTTGYNPTLVRTSRVPKNPRMGLSQHSRGVIFSRNRPVSQSGGVWLRSVSPVQSLAPPPRHLHEKAARAVVQRRPESCRGGITIAVGPSRVLLSRPPSPPLASAKRLVSSQHDLAGETRIRAV